MGMAEYCMGPGGFAAGNSVACSNGDSIFFVNHGCRIRQLKFTSLSLI